MIRVFFHNNEAIEKTEGIEILNSISVEQLLWVDLQFSTPEEQSQIESHFDINFTNQEEESGLESNARFVLQKEK